MMDNTIEIQEELSHAPMISVVGVGGAGNNTMGHLVRSGTFSNIRLIIANTDMQHMLNNPVKERIILGKKGLGAGMRPEQGKAAAEESYEEIKRALDGSDLIIISAGLGGGTGTGAAPIVAKAAKEVGALTVAVVTKPFKHEGSKRMRFADEGLKALYEVCDSIVVIPNEKLLSMIGKNTSYAESMSYVDDVVARAVNGISSVILTSSGMGINVDFQDLKTIMSHKGLALMSIGEGEGEDAAQQAIKSAIESPLFDNISINGSLGAIVYFEFNSKMPMMQIMSSMEMIEESASDDADIIFGTNPKDNFDENKVRVSIIITGIEKSQGISVPKSIPTTPDSNTNAQVMQTNIESSSEQKPQQKGAQNLFNFHYEKKVSGSEITEEVLDIPTYQRMQKD
ncbi:cell division protein FtsZ [Helicobacter saguini]|nr:cell division protein FtsZ [Helicobacter saguini]